MYDNKREHKANRVKGGLPFFYLICFIIYKDLSSYVSSPNRLPKKFDR